jgi:dephospho-CoA kinase
MRDMYVVVLTGGLGAGKSSAGSMMADLGAVVLDLDTIAKRLLEPGQPLAEAVAMEFPDAVDDNDAIDQRALAQLAFMSPAHTLKLNAIMHPALAREVGPALADLRLLPQPPEVVVLEVPLLVEAPVFAEMADLVVAISAPEEVRVARAVAAGMTEVDARTRVSRQASDLEREALSDEVIENTGSVDDLRREVERVWNEAVKPHAG